MSGGGQGRHLLKKSDFVDLVDESGEVVGSVPKHWRDADLPAGTRKTASRATPAAASGERKDAPPKDESPAKPGDEKKDTPPKP